MAASKYDKPNRRDAMTELLRLILANLCLATFVFQFFSFAQKPTEGIGHLSNVIGKVEIVRSGKTLPAEKDTILLETDELVTYDKTAVKIVFNDGSNLMAFQNARVKVAEYKIKAKGEDASDVKSAIDVVKGKVRFFVKPQEDKQIANTDAKFKTSNSVMGIRGTSGFIDASVPGNTQVIVTTGNVQVTSISDPSKSVIVPANKFTEVFGNKPPTVPKVVPPAILNKLNSDAAAVDPNFRKSEQTKQDGDSKKKEEQQKKKQDKENKQGDSTQGSSGQTAAESSSSSDQKKQVFNPDGTSSVVSTNSEMNNLLVTQGNTSVRPTGNMDYDPIKNSLQQVDTLTSSITRQINTIISTSTSSQTSKSINIIINNPSLPQ